MSIKNAFRAAVAAVAAAGLAAPAQAPAGVSQPYSVFLPIIEPIHHAEVADSELAYRLVGRGAPLLLIPSRDVGEWDPSVVFALSQGRRVIIYDPRGAG